MTNPVVDVLDLQDRINRLERGVWIWRLAVLAALAVAGVAVTRTWRTEAPPTQLELFDGKNRLVLKPSQITLSTGNDPTFWVHDGEVYASKLVVQDTTRGGQATLDPTSIGLIAKGAKSTATLSVSEDGSRLSLVTPGPHLTLEAGPLGASTSLEHGKNVIASSASADQAFMSVATMAAHVQIWSDAEAACSALVVEHHDEANRNECARLKK
jgi:hypothetical protein